MLSLLSSLVRRQDEDDPSNALPPPPDDYVPAHHASPVVAFIIGLAIVTLASVLNAAGLNLTKLDHVRTSAIPKSSRRKDWLRPLWLLGMLLYILSQLIGSTLALQYMRAEYVAPLGSTSLIFNFMFARFLIGTPVHMNDIYGTIVIILGVIGIVAFGSINSGLSNETDATHLTHLWARGPWIGFFIFMTLALLLLFVFTTQLDLVLASRSDLSSVPFAAMSARMASAQGQRQEGGLVKRVRQRWAWGMVWIAERLEMWTAGKDDKVVAWTLGIGWACCGGGMAGECLVFAKAAVKLISGSLSHENPGNQVGHAAPIFTFIFLASTAVLQIVCLNRGLKAYDSTLVVPVFYGVYTATGWLDSLIFNASVDAYASWTLFLIFVSILILISGVVLLTHKKPDVPAHPPNADDITLSSVPRPNGKGKGRRRKVKKGDVEEGADDEREGLRAGEDGADGVEGRDGEVMWDVGEASDDEDDETEGHDEDDPTGDRTPRAARSTSPSTAKPASKLGTGGNETEEGMYLMRKSHDEEHDHEEEVAASTSTHTLGPMPQQTRRRSTSSVSLIDADEDEMEAEFGEFKSSEVKAGQSSSR